MALNLRILMTTAGALLATHVGADTVCTGQAGLLAQREGVYASKQLLEVIRKTRRWDKTHPDASGISEVRISSAGEVTLSFGWHEGGTLGKEYGPGCLVFEGRGMRLRHAEFKKAGPFERLAGTTGLPNDGAPYFGLLFKGCFADAQGERWCFGASSIDIAGTMRRAKLLVDKMELPAGGSVVEVAGDPDFLLFVPKGRGWAGYRTTWASAEGFREPAWSRPWKILTPAK